jgi:small subunit ribosomal protein S5
MMQKNPERFEHKKEKEFDEKVIKINRVSKKTKGGNKLSFSVLMVIGDRKGRVGVGLGKAAGVPEAMKKASVNARKKLIKVPTQGNTISREMKYKKGAATIFLKPAAPGTGLIAGTSVKAVIELSGIRDILSKVIGTTNQTMNVYATYEALQALNYADAVYQERRGKKEDKKKD